MPINETITNMVVSSVGTAILVEIHPNRLFLQLHLNRLGKG